MKKSTIAPAVLATLISTTAPQTAEARRYDAAAETLLELFARGTARCVEREPCREAVFGEDTIKPQLQQPTPLQPMSPEAFQPVDGHFPPPPPIIDDQLRSEIEARHKAYKQAIEQSAENNKKLPLVQPLTPEQIERFRTRNELPQQEITEGKNTNDPSVTIFGIGPNGQMVTIKKDGVSETFDAQSAPKPETQTAPKADEDKGAPKNIELKEFHFESFKLQ